MGDSKPSLEDRFMAFLNRLEGSENIDDSLSNGELSYGKRADFLQAKARAALYAFAEMLDHTCGKLAKLEKSLGHGIHHPATLPHAEES